MKNNTSSFQTALKLCEEEVAYAAQICSCTVAAAMESMVASENLPAEAILTAECVHFIDTLLDSLKSRNVKPFEGSKVAID